MEDETDEIADNPFIDAVPPESHERFRYENHKIIIWTDGPMSEVKHLAHHLKDYDVVDLVYIDDIEVV